MTDDRSILPTSDGHHDRMDMRMVQRAVNERWPIPTEYKKVIVTEAMRYVADRSKSDKARQRAMDMLAKLDKDNHDRLMDAIKLEHAESNPANPAHPLTVNVGIVVPGQVQQLAADPDKFREFAKLAESVQSPKDAP